MAKSPCSLEELTERFGLPAPLRPDPIANARLGGEKVGRSPVVAKPRRTPEELTERVGRGVRPASELHGSCSIAHVVARRRRESLKETIRG